jgi:hypothetical protein
MAPRVGPQAIAERRRLEDELLALGAEHEQLREADSINRERTRALLAPAREAGITIRDIARLTGFSTQSLHSWIRAARPASVPAPPPARTGSLGEGILRVIGEEPGREWSTRELRAAIPAGWPSGTLGEIETALESLANVNLVSGNRERGYRLAPPPPYTR